MSAYATDPRIEWATPDRFYLPDPRDLWSNGDRWSVELEDEGGFWRRRTASWSVYDPDGNLHREASGKANFDEALAVLIGPPLWDVMAEMLLEAYDNGGYLPAEGGAEDVDTTTCAGSAAIENLEKAGCFVVRSEDRVCVGYVLTDRGRYLAENLPGRSDADVQNLITVNVPQLVAFGITESDPDW